MAESSEIDNLHTLPFPAVIGQTAVRKHLRQAIETDRLAHAFLFVGPDGVGRTALAFELARALNCKERRFDSADSPCQCSSCYRIRKLEHPNLSLVFPLPSADTEKQKDEAHRLFEQMRASKAEDPYAPVRYTGTGQIHIDLIRSIINEFSFSAGSEGIRTAIIQPAEKLNTNAANALLKNLEEPPARSCFILIVNSLRSLLPTIISRCQVLKLSPLSVDEIQSALIERRQVDPQKAAAVAKLAGGNYARAAALLDDALAAQLAESLEFLRRAAMSDLSVVVPKIDGWSRDSNRQETLERLNYLSIWIRDALLLKSFNREDAQGYLSTTGHENTIERMGARYSESQLAKVWEEIEETRLDIESNALTAMALAALAVKIHRILR